MKRINLALFLILLVLVDTQHAAEDKDKKPTPTPDSIEDLVKAANRYEYLVNVLQGVVDETAPKPTPTPAPKTR